MAVANSGGFLAFRRPPEPLPKLPTLGGLLALGNLRGSARCHRRSPRGAAGPMQAGKQVLSAHLGCRRSSVPNVREPNHSGADRACRSAPVARPTVLALHWRGSMKVGFLPAPSCEPRSCHALFSRASAPDQERPASVERGGRLTCQQRQAHCMGRGSLTAGRFTGSLLRTVAPPCSRAAAEMARACCFVLISAQRPDRATKCFFGNLRASITPSSLSS